ncbi:MAG: hypothetical protein RMK01_06855 [Thermomicrobium sp.]|nr:hypothetical protein [Thermomicrobium sp.]MDW8059780.1 hypothetical protein [Thermomicrobium sp.]
MHHQHEQDFGDDDAEVELGTEQVLHQDDQRADHETEEHDDEGDDQHILCSFEKTP